MAGASAVRTASGIPVPAEAAATADELAAIMREALRDLPFGAEPAEFLVALEELADPEGEGSP
jgi:hypothetical protein